MCKYFVQVLSNTVASELKLYGGAEASETATFIELMDKFFDSFNVLSLSKEKTEKKIISATLQEVDRFSIKSKSHTCK